MFAEKPHFQEGGLSQVALSWEADSEVEISMQGVYYGMLLNKQLWKGKTGKDAGFGREGS